MQRKLIDETEFAVIQGEMTDFTVYKAGQNAVVTGRHEDHGTVGLVQDGGRFLALADDVHRVRGVGEVFADEI